MAEKTSAIRVRTRYATVEDFVVGYHPFFDSRGLFVRTRRLQDVGTRLRFELQLADGRAAFRGEGIVDEVREPPRSASGMHLRITKLDRTSKQLFEQITALRTESLGATGAQKAASGDYTASAHPSGNGARSSVVLGGAAASSGSSSDASSDAMEPQPEASHDPLPAPEPAGDELSSNVLEEIADGIELSLDSVLSSGPVDPSGAADLAGFFGSPRELEEARRTGQFTPLGGVTTLGSGAQAAVASPPEGAFDHSSQAEAVRAWSEDHDDVAYHEEDLGLDDVSGIERLGVGVRDAEIVEDDEFLGDEDDEDVVYEEDVVDTVPAQAALAELSVPAGEPKRPQQTELRREVQHSQPHTFVEEDSSPKLDDLLSDLLHEEEAATRGDAAGSSAMPGPEAEPAEAAMAMLDDEDDEDEDEVARSSDGEPDPLDEMLAKEDQPEPEEKKRGFFRRIFGRKD